MIAAVLVGVLLCTLGSVAILAVGIGCMALREYLEDHLDWPMWSSAFVFGALAATPAAFVGLVWGYWGWLLLVVIFTLSAALLSAAFELVL